MQLSDWRVETPIHYQILLYDSGIQRTVAMGADKTFTSSAGCVFTGGLCLMRIAHARFLSDTPTLSDGVRVCRATGTDSGSGSWHFTSVEASV